MHQRNLPWQAGFWPIGIYTWKVFYGTRPYQQPSSSRRNSHRGVCDRAWAESMKVGTPSLVSKVAEVCFSDF